MLKQKTPTRNIELRIAYVGTHFSGWQIQPDRRTVQGVLNRALRALLRVEEVRTIASSRTDAGVHAHDQRVSFRVEKPIPIGSLKRALNHKLPHDLRVLEAKEREPSFSARYNARGKHYAYYIYNAESFSPLIAPYVWKFGRSLDAARMNAGAKSWIGTRCFKSFQSHKDARAESESTIFACEVYRLENLVVFEILGQHFLYHMVRNMLASLVKLGTGEWSLAEFEERSLSGKRVRQWITAPARGLHLFEVFFETGPFGLSAKSGRMAQSLCQLNAGLDEDRPASREAGGEGSPSPPGALGAWVRKGPGTF